MKRKLVRQAGQAVTITLPIEWIRQNNLEAGDEIDVSNEENALIIRGSGENDNKKAEFDCKNISPVNYSTLLNAFYALGCDEVTLDNIKEELSLNQFTGYVVTERKDDRRVVKDITGTTTSNFEEVFKRAFQALMQNFDEAIEGILNGDKKITIEDIYQKDREINKLCLYLERAVMKSKYKDPDIGKIIFAFSISLEKIGDDICRMWKSTLENKLQNEPNVKKILELAKESLSLAFKIYYQTNDNLLNELHQIKERIRRLSQDIKYTSNMRIVYGANSIYEECRSLTQLSYMKKIKELSLKA